MLNAEDTKERIRKLRLKVISEPLVSGSTGDLDQQIANKNELQKDWETGSSLLGMIYL